MFIILTKYDILSWVIMMIGFIRGKVESINEETITLDVNGVGYEILVSNPEKFQLYQDTIIYTYLKISENDISLYGFLFK